MSILGWATASDERAKVNARAAAIECSRHRVEWAEGAHAVAELAAAYAVPITPMLLRPSDARKARGPALGSLPG